MLREQRRQQIDCGNQFTGLKRRIEIGPLARLPMKLRERNRPLVLRTRDAHDGIQRRSATLMSGGFLAMHWELAPRIACMRLLPSITAQSLPGMRLLQWGKPVS